jgi:hypothetical protein
MYFEEESNVFGDAQDDFSFTMTDPSAKYFFDVNPERNIYTNSSLDANHSETPAGSIHNNNNNDLFVAHFVNDASFADFSPIVNAAKELRQQHNQQQKKENDVRDFVKKGEELDEAAARLAMEYLGTSTGTLTTTSNITRKEAASTTKSSGFNVVMCAFSPPPLVAYVTIKPVQRGEEFLASYGLGYWLGKAFPEDGDEVLDAVTEALETRPEVRRAQHRAETVMEAALEAGDDAVRKEYGRQTQVISDTFAEFRRARKEETRQRTKPWWKRRRLRRRQREDKATK